MAGVAEIDTRRLRLRPLSIEDLEPLAEIWTHPDVARGLITRPRGRADVERLFVAMIHDARRWGMWAIVHKADDALIGRCGFYAFRGERSIVPELAFFLAKPYWGAGLATEAGHACLRHLFRSPVRARAVATVLPDNLASQRVLEKIGMRALRHIAIASVPAILYAIERTGFRADDRQRARRDA